MKDNSESALSTNKEAISNATKNLMESSSWLRMNAGGMLNTCKSEGAGNAKVIVSMSGQIGEELPFVSMNIFETTARERETERFQEFLLCLSGNVDDHVESDIFGGPIF
jgi:hypothetical protein